LNLLEVARKATKRRIKRLTDTLSKVGLNAVLLFDNDPLAYKLALTHHLDTVLVTNENIYVVTGPAYALAAGEETPWEAIESSSADPSSVADAIAALLPTGATIGVNKAWGRTKIGLSNLDLIELLKNRLKANIIDATSVLENVFDKPYNDEMVIVEWLPRTASRALEAAVENIEPGIREAETAGIVDKTLYEERDHTDGSRQWLSPGPRAATPHAKTSTRRIRPRRPGHGRRWPTMARL